MRMPRLQLKALLIDLNGTLHVGLEPTPRAVEAVARLRHSKLPFLFCSNSTKEADSDLVAKLGKMGFDIRPDEVMTSLGACRQLVDDRQLRPLLLLSDSAKGDFEHLDHSEHDSDSVIVGLDPDSLSYENLNKAFRVLKSEPPYQNGQNSSRTPPSLIAPHTSMFQQTPASDTAPAGLSLGIGPFVRALETAAGINAEIVGKPTKRFFELALERLRGLHRIDCDASEVAIIGDDVVNDLGHGAQELRLKRYLVRTGKYRQGVEDGHDVDGVYSDFAALVDDLV